MCDTSSTEASLPAGSILATLQAAQRGSSMSALEAEQVVLSLMEDGSLDLDTLMERISGAEPEDGRREEAPGRGGGGSEEAAALLHGHNLQRSLGGGQPPT